MQAHLPTGDFLHDKLLAFPVQHITVDLRGCNRLRPFQSLCVSDHCAEEQDSKKNWHDSSSLFFRLLVAANNCQWASRCDPSRFHDPVTSTLPPTDEVIIMCAVYNSRRSGIRIVDSPCHNYSMLVVRG